MVVEPDEMCEGRCRNEVRGGEATKKVRNARARALWLLLWVLLAEQRAALARLACVAATRCGCVDETADLACCK
jgi:hypothetical protein